MQAAGDRRAPVALQHADVPQRSRSACRRRRAERAPGCGSRFHSCSIAGATPPPAAAAAQAADCVGNTRTVRLGTPIRRAAGRGRTPGRWPSGRRATPRSRSAAATTRSAVRAAVVVAGDDQQPVAQQRLADDTRRGRPGERRAEGHVGEPLREQGAHLAVVAMPSVASTSDARRANACSSAGATASPTSAEATTRSRSGAPLAMRTASSVATARLTICDASPTTRWPAGVRRRARFRCARSAGRRGSGGARRVPG